MEPQPHAKWYEKYDPVKRYGSTAADAKWFQKPKFLYCVMGFLLLIILTLIAFILYLIFRHIDTYEDTCLYAHNKLRRLHDVPPLELNETITEYALNWAQIIAAEKNAEFRRAGIFGENIFIAKGKNNLECEHAVKAWYKEGTKFDYKSKTIPLGTGHFTQVIWKDSRQLGCASVNSSDLLYIVCNYDPSGNLEDIINGNLLVNKLPLSAYDAAPPLEHSLLIIVFCLFVLRGF